MASSPPQEPAEPSTNPRPASPVPAPSEPPPAGTENDEQLPETSTPQDEPVWPTSPDD
jgi:hypothetical protein